MKLKTFYVRFYKSFNYDYLRKNHEKGKFDPWDEIEAGIYPYVKIPIEREVTAVVGANESGKSHLLTAIPKGLTGEGIETEDMCRYSQFATVEKDKLRRPDFGFEFDELTEDEKAAIVSLSSENPSSLSSFFLFRSQGVLTLYFKSADEYISVVLDDESEELVTSLLPKVFTIESEIALPDRVPIDSIIKIAEGDLDELPPSVSTRNAAFELIDSLMGNRSLFDGDEVIKTNAATINSVMADYWDKVDEKESAPQKQKRRAEIKLAHDLICKIANVDPQSLRDLQSAVRNRKDGHAEGIVNQINKELNDALNFPNWWVQDKEFKLVVKSLDRDLAFTILDRTGTHYSFSERSNGLKYFLSYYVQYLAHEAPDEGWEILTMDEPDAYLSSQAQQDLLKIFDSFANSDADESKKSIQVLYVTHSPFLVDKNHSERIRVLEKGSTDEGTRVVRDVSKNHYEPLRSAFGAFVGETAFIGNINIFVEGPADQILLAGASKLCRRLGKMSDEALDLNRITVVPAGGATHVPYLVYLAIGRDAEKPAVVVLLDSDTEGSKAKKTLERQGLRGKQILSPEFILQIGDINENDKLTLSTKKVVDTEDLIPLGLCCAAIREYLATFCSFDKNDLEPITIEWLQSRIGDSKLFDAIVRAVGTLRDSPHIEKVGFARSLVDVLSKAPSDLRQDIEKFANNFAVLFVQLNRMCRSAQRLSSEVRVSSKVRRQVKNFRLDNPAQARRQAAFELFEQIGNSLDDTVESDEIRTQLIAIRRDFNIDLERDQLIERYADFVSNLEKLSTVFRNATQEEEYVEVESPLKERKIPATSKPGKSAPATST